MHRMFTFVLIIEDDNDSWSWGELFYPYIYLIMMHTVSLDNAKVPSSSKIKIGHGVSFSILEDIFL